MLAGGRGLPAEWGSGRKEVTLMQENPQPGGSATRSGALFGAPARDWAETGEGPGGWRTPVYEHVLDRAKIGSGTRVLDCGCGAGRFAQMAADRGASVAGTDAAEELIEIAAERTPDGDFRVGDLDHYGVQATVSTLPAGNA
jgi:SAM-dependent methyltransferase